MPNNNEDFCDLSAEDDDGIRHNSGRDKHFQDNESPRLFNSESVFGPGISYATKDLNSKQGQLNC